MQREIGASERIPSYTRVMPTATKSNRPRVAPRAVACAGERALQNGISESKATAPPVRPQKKKRKPKQADRADRHDLYQRSVQSVGDEIEFIAARYREIRGRDLRRIREDFCGTAQMACAWAGAGKDHEAIGVDIDPEVLAWGREHNFNTLPAAARSRVCLLQEDVLQVRTEPVEAILAMNFSYWLFRERATLLAYFRKIRDALVEDGVLFLDAYGGYEAPKVITEKRECDGFIYIWEQAEFDPVSHRMACHIHFKFPDGSKMKRAFSYEWRLWSLPELKELLAEAGFRESQVWWEGADEDGDGNGEFERVEVGEPDAGWVAYLVAVK